MNRLYLVVSVTMLGFSMVALCSIACFMLWLSIVFFVRVRCMVISFLLWVIFGVCRDIYIVRCLLVFVSGVSVFEKFQTCSSDFFFCNGTMFLLLMRFHWWQMCAFWVA